MTRFAVFLFLVLIHTGSNKSEEGSFGLQKDNASLTISGSSTLHNWKMHLKTFDCRADFIFSSDHLSSIEQAHFRCQASDLESESSLMDKKAHSAMKSESFPEIQFDLISPAEIIYGNDKSTGNLTGKLYLAGKSETVTLPVTTGMIRQNGNDVITVNGQLELKMSDFDISPPVLMMGALKTGDAVTVSFSLQFSRN
jgi:hypothetical protein